MSIIKQINSINVSDFDALVEKTYNKKYNFQQQDGCQPRGVRYFTVPLADPYDFENDSIPIKVNGDEMGVSFKAWLEAEKFPGLTDYREDLFWDRNFYPSLDMVVQDLHKKGLIPAGEYQIVIDW